MYRVSMHIQLVRCLCVNCWNGKIGQVGDARAHQRISAQIIMWNHSERLK